MWDEKKINTHSLKRSKVAGDRLLGLRSTEGDDRLGENRRLLFVLPRDLRPRESDLLLDLFRRFSLLWKKY